MTTPSFHSMMRSGGGRYGLVFHIAGYPWYATSDTDLLDALAPDTGSITAFADAGGGDVTVTSAAHGLTVGDNVFIEGTTNYNNKFNVTVSTTNTFDITAAWAGDDATGTYKSFSVGVAAYLADMFASQYPPIGGKANIPYYDMTSAATLDPNIGGQSVSYDEGKGLTGGNWTVNLAREPSGLTYDYRPAGETPNGVYAGLDVVENPLYDGSICTGIVATNCNPGGTDTEITWGNDTGLYALVTTNTTAKNLTYIWAGNSCYAIHTPVDNGDGTYTAKIFSGIWRSPSMAIWASFGDGANTMISNVPGDVIGKAANLWMIPLTEDGDIVDIDSYAGDPAPILFRTGPIVNNPRGDSKSWKISIGHWLKWLDATIPTDEFEGHLSGFHFARHSESGGYASCQSPHFVLQEWTGGAFDTKSFWLCAAGGSVSFESRSALATAVAEELESATFSAAKADLEYNVSENEFVCSYGGTTTKSTMICGPVPLCMGWGWTKPNYLSYYTSDQSLDKGWVGNIMCGVGDWQLYKSGVHGGYIDAAFAYSITDRVGTHNPYKIRGNPWAARFVTTLIASVPELYDSGGAKLDPPMLMRHFRLEYFYQWNWACSAALQFGYNDSHEWHTCEAGGYLRDECGYRTKMDAEGPFTGFPLPKTSDGDYRMTIGDSYSVELLSNGTGLSIGSGQLMADEGHTELLWESEIKATGDNYLTTPTSDYDTWDNDDTTPVLRVSQQDTWYPTTMVWGQDMLWMPAIHGSADPWAITQQNEVSSNSVRELFRGLLNGTNQSANIPERHRVTTIPDSVGTDSPTADRELIDWSRLNTLADGAGFAAARYALQLNAPKQKLSALLQGVLLSLGIRPVWEYCEDQRSWWLSFEPFGRVSKVDAQTHGRILDDGAIMPEKPPTEISGNTWLYHSVDGKCNFRGKDAGISYSIDNKTGLALEAGGGKTLKFDDKILQLNSADGTVLLSNIRTMLGLMNTVPEVVTIRCNPSVLTTIGAGTSALLTSDVITSRFTGTRGVTRVGCLVTKVNPVIAKNKFEVDVTLRITPITSGGWAPSMHVTGAKQTLVGTTLTIDSLPTTAAASDFVDPSQGLTDLARFGCMKWSNSTDETETYNATCGCTAYAVWAFRADATAYATAGGSQNVWAGRLGHSSSKDALTVADVNGGDCVIELDNANNFDAAKDLIIIFADRDHADLQDCQSSYGFLGDETGKCQDASGDDHRAFSWS
ncbi:MAG: hypothetical protein GY832_03055 [Chloroflexi bacterium]|nr:hypothetical protein [Chloroflexota bacterium]